MDLHQLVKSHESYAVSYTHLQVFEQVARTDGQRRILSRMGYLLGRWIYMMDAFDDLESDLKRGNYNPLIGRYGLRGGEDYNRAAIGQDLSLIHI